MASTSPSPRRPPRRRTSVARRFATALHGLRRETATSPAAGRSAGRARVQTLATATVGSPMRGPSRGANALSACGVNLRQHATRSASPAPAWARYLPTSPGRRSRGGRWCAASRTGSARPDPRPCSRRSGRGCRWGKLRASSFLVERLGRRDGCSRAEGRGDYFKDDLLRVAHVWSRRRPRAGQGTAAAC